MEHYNDRIVRNSDKVYCINLHLTAFFDTKMSLLFCALFKTIVVIPTFTQDISKFFVKMDLIYYLELKLVKDYGYISEV